MLDSLKHLFVEWQENILQLLLRRSMKTCALMLFSLLLFCGSSLGVAQEMTDFDVVATNSIFICSSMPTAVRIGRPITATALNCSSACQRSLYDCETRGFGNCEVSRCEVAPVLETIDLLENKNESHQYPTATPPHLGSDAPQ